MSMRDLYLGVRLDFESDTERKHSEEILRRLLGIICRHNLLYLLRNPSTKPLYDSGVVYSPPDQTTAPTADKGKIRQLLELLASMKQPPETREQVLRLVRGAEVFLDIPSLYERGHGDCNELVPVRVAELWRAGISATPWLVDPVPNPGGGLSYHAIVVYLDDYTMEDPSLILGMGGPSRVSDREEARRQNRERFGNYMSAAKHLIEAEGAHPMGVGKQIDLMGLLPRDGRFVP